MAAVPCQRWKCWGIWLCSSTSVRIRRSEHADSPRGGVRLRRPGDGHRAVLDGGRDRTVRPPRPAVRAEALPGARELVDLVAERVPFAVASNSPRALLDTALARGGFTVEVSVAADEVAAPKPAPDRYLAACAALDVAPGECARLASQPDSRPGGRDRFSGSLLASP
ncbi:MAG TPA: HAD family hydrolase [Amycolatopsis sp.]